MRVKEAPVQICSAGKLSKQQRKMALSLGNNLVPNNVPGLLYLVATKGEQVVGVLYADCASTPAILHVLAVDPKQQRLGIGLQLVQDFEHRMDFLGITEIEVDCTSSESQSLFEKVGYSFEGKHGRKPAWSLEHNLNF